MWSIVLHKIVPNSGLHLCWLSGGLQWENGWIFPLLQPHPLINICYAFGTGSLIDLDLTTGYPSWHTPPNTTFFLFVHFTAGAQSNNLLYALTA